MAHRSGFAPPGMRPLRHCLMVALICLLLGAHTVQAQACPSVVTKARARATSKFAIIKMRVALPKGTPYVDNAAIKVTLPQGVSPVVSTRISSSQKGATRAILPYANGVNVYFTGLRLRKSITIQIKVGRITCAQNIYSNPYNSMGKDAQRPLSAHTLHSHPLSPGEAAGLYASKRPGVWYALLPGRRPGQRDLSCTRHS